jgi:hypothetical protein
MRERERERELELELELELERGQTKELSFNTERGPIMSPLCHIIVLRDGSGFCGWRNKLSVSVSVSVSRGRQKN